MSRKGGEEGQKTEDGQEGEEPEYEILDIPLIKKYIESFFLYPPLAKRLNREVQIWP
jgi:hypothetical protein